MAHRRRTVMVIFAGIVLLAGVIMATSQGLRAQIREREIRPDLFPPFGLGAELGVSVREVSPDDIAAAKLGRPEGVYVESVRDSSPAALAGFRAGDIIVTFDGERVRGVRHFSRLVLESPAGRAVRAEIVRAGTRQSLEVTPEAADRIRLPLPEIREQLESSLRALPRDFDLEPPVPLRPARVRLGVTLTPLTAQLAAYFGVSDGMLVSSVEPQTPAAQAGMRAGDVLTAIDGRSVRTQGDVAAAVRRAAPGASLDVTLMREKKQIAVKVILAEREPTGDRITI
jgi:serine protease Do